MTNLTLYCLHSRYIAFTHAILHSLMLYCLHARYIAFTRAILPSFTLNCLHSRYIDFTHAILPSLTLYCLHSRYSCKQGVEVLRQRDNNWNALSDGSILMKRWETSHYSLLFYDKRAIITEISEILSFKEFYQCI